ncbi:MFS transporter [Salidesulfovibrio brasiliensis]
MIETNNDMPFNTALKWVLFIAALFLLNFLGRIIFGPLMPVIREELGLTHAQAGSIFLMIGVGNAAGLLCNGLVSRRLGHRRTVALCSLLVGLASLLVSTSTDFSGIRLLTLLLGFVSGIYLPSGVASVTVLTRKKDWGKAMAVHELAPNIAFVAAPLLAEAAVLAGDWRDAFRLLGALQIVVGLLFFLRGKGADFPGIPLSPKSALPILRRPLFWLFALLFSIAVGASIGPYSMLTLYLVTDHGMDRVAANQLLAAARVAGIVIPFAAGWITDRLGGRAAVGLYLALVGAATVFLGLTSGPALKAAVLIQPALSVLFYPPAFALLSATFQAEERSLAVSLLTPISASIGLGLTPTVLGWLGDHGHFGLGFAGQGCLLLAALFLLPMLPRR